ncbi:unnamed protein product [Acanthosepion pharaonis]|uniref:Uncharacterized protein n=1 Tax=Acanthosepion pharaonis TaxID=158019 RepID=A0A812AIV8_ACAPH|nr:unnamed protein product [Sepia pharaonis]
MSINWLVEKVIIYYKTTEVADPILGAHNDAELYELQWWCRKFHCLIGLVILIFASWHYSDINAENNVLLKQIQDFLFNARYRRRVSAVDHLSPEQSQQKEPDIQNGNSSTGYESDSSVSSHTSYVNESSDATYTLNDADSVSTISSHSSWMSLRQELCELDEEAAENEANRLSSPSTSRSNQIYSSTPLRRAPVHMARSADHRYNLRPRTTNNSFNSTKSLTLIDSGIFFLDKVCRRTFHGTACVILTVTGRKSNLIVYSLNSHLASLNFVQHFRTPHHFLPSFVYTGPSLIFFFFFPVNCAS